MNFEWNLFQFTARDCLFLAKVSVKIDMGIMQSFWDFIRHKETFVTGVKTHLSHSKNTCLQSGPSSSKGGLCYPLDKSLSSG